LVEIGSEMGLKGTALAAFVRDEQARERDQRQAEREEASWKVEADRMQEMNLIREKRENLEMEMEFKRQLEKEREEKAIQEHERKLELMSLQEKQKVKQEGVDQST